MDWRSLDQVKRVCAKLNAEHNLIGDKRCVVTRAPGMDNYNITHLRSAKKNGRKIVWLGKD